MTRLGAVCSLLRPAGTVADVGCDHGRVALYCARSGMFDAVIASDISDECLDKARKTLSGLDNVRFICCDGIDYECDEAVIAGMGGVNISEILARADKLPQDLVLCPHRDAEALRRKLVELGYFIDSDLAVEERGRVYFVMRASRGFRKELSELQYRFGVNYDEKCEALQHCLIKLYNIYKKAPEKNADKLRYVCEALRAQGLEKYI